MGVTNDLTDPEGTALRGIEATERFFHAIGMPTSIHELLGRKVTDDEIALMVQKCSRGGTITLGSIEKIGPKEMETIYRMAL
jgi:alcohol dehydrogenase YqhD (iron-dependent ADH family)